VPATGAAASASGALRVNCDVTAGLPVPSAVTGVVNGVRARRGQGAVKRAVGTGHGAVNRPPASRSA